MKAFIFTPANEFHAKFNFHRRDDLESELASFLASDSRALPHGSYMEALGDTWTIVSRSPLVLEEGRVETAPVPPTAPPLLPSVTTETFPGHTITGTCGIVTGEAIMGANIFRDLSANLTDIIGGRSSSYEDNLRKGRHHALSEMNAEARRLRADVIIGVRFHYESIASRGMFMICAAGTAVTVQKDAP